MQCLMSSGLVDDDNVKGNILHNFKSNLKQI